MAELSSSKPPGPQSVQRAVALLGVFGDADPDLSLTSMAARAGLPVSTTYRLAQALQHAGLLERALDGERYRIGAGLVTLAAPALHRLNVAALAPALQSLAGDIEISASFGVAGERDVLTLFSARPSTRFCGNQLPGPRQSLADSAMGMAVRAFNGHRPEPHLDAVRRLGYADTAGSQGPHVRAIAVPVIDADGAWGAVGVQALRRRLTDDLLRDVLPVIRRHAARMVRPAALSGVG